jgi:hypothetical protein
LTTTPVPIPKNPFRPGAGTKPVYLAGRSSEQNAFIGALKQDPLSQNIIITGLRGVGKTVLLDELKPLALAHGWLWTGNDWSETASISEKDVATRLLVDLAAILAPIVRYRADELPFGFTSKRKGNGERPLRYDDLVSIYNNTPGFVSDKLKAVLEHVTLLLKPTKVRGVVFACRGSKSLGPQRHKSIPAVSCCGRFCFVFANLH